MADKQVIRPLINSAPVSEFGAALPEDGNEYKPVDLLHVPGFSEMRYKRDFEMAEYAAGTRRGQDVSTLPVNVAWVTCTKGTGDTPNSTQLMQWKNEGYKSATSVDIGKPWLTGLPGGATVRPDGTIVNAAGDMQLVWADAATVARNKARKARLNEDQLESIGQNLGDGAEGIYTATRNVSGLKDVSVTRTTVKP